MIDLVVKGTFKSAVGFSAIARMMGEVARAALEDYSEVVERDAKQDFTAQIKHKDKSTGATAKTIRGFSKKNEKTGRVVSGVAVDFPGGLIEIGTKKMPARPFLRPAAERNKSRVGRMVNRAFDREEVRAALK